MRISLLSKAALVFVLAFALKVLCDNTLYTYTFKGPFYAHYLPGWEYGGSAIMTDNYIRLTPALKGRTGYLWNYMPVQTNDWEVEFTFKIHNTIYMGGDGLAFWYSKSRNVGSGNKLYGHDENFEGFGLIVDTYDNNANFDNPKVVGIVGTGQHRNWDTGNDLTNDAIGSCTSTVRNTGQPSKIIIRYQQETIQVLVDPNSAGTNMVNCFTANVKLPSSGYFGFTAQTGDLSDFHDLYSVTARDLSSSTETENGEKKPKKRGLFDPYQHQWEQQQGKAAPAPSAEPTPIPVTSTIPESHTHASTQAESRPSWDHESSDAHVAETVDQAIREFKESLNQQYAQAQANAETTAPPSTQPAYTTSAPSADNQDLHAKLRQYEQKEAEYINKLRDLEESSRTERDQLVAEKEAREKKTKSELMTIYTVLEAIGNVLKEKPTKQTHREMAATLADASSKTTVSNNEIKVLRQKISEDVNNLVTNLKAENQKLKDHVSSLESHIAALAGELDEMAKQQKSFSTHMDESTENISSSISRTTSFGFWLFFILLELALLAGWNFYRKYKAERNKKLF